MDYAESIQLRRPTTPISVTSSSDVDRDSLGSMNSDDPDSNRLHSNVIYLALRIIMKMWVSDWHLLGGWPTSKKNVCLMLVPI